MSDARVPNDPATEAGWRIAVDFGTSATVAAVVVGGGQPQLLQLEQDSNRMPSVVFLERGGQLAVGRRAANQAMTAPERFHPAPKRDVGQESVTLGGTRVRVEDMVAEIFARVLVEAFRQRGTRPPEAVVLTHPVRWGSERTGQLRRAFAAAAMSLPVRLRAAGLPEPVAAAAESVPEPQLVTEPVAAAWHYAADHRIPSGASLAVYDLGGGTFDTAVVEHSAAGGFAVRANGGLADLGGEDFDAALFEFLGTERLAGIHPERWQRILDPGDDHGAWSDQRGLHEHARMAKEELSTRWQVECRLLDDPLVEIVLRREELNQVIEPDLRRSFDALAATLEQAGLDGGTPEGIYLVGGSSRIPLVSALMQEQLGIEPTPLDDPKAVVALGALAATRDRPTGPSPGTPAMGQASAAKDKASAAKEQPSARPSARPSPRRPAKLTAELTHQISCSKATWVVFSPDLSRFAAGCHRTTDINAPTALEVFDRSGAQLTVIREPIIRGIRAAAFSPDGTRIATAAHMGARVWDAASGRQLLDVKHPRSPRGVAFSPDGSLLGTSAAKHARAFDAVTGRQLMQVRLAAGETGTPVDFGPGGRLAVGGLRAAYIWDTSTGEKVFARRFRGIGTAIKAIAFSPDGRLIVATVAKQTVIWPATGGEGWQVTQKSVEPSRLAFSADSGLLAIGAGMTAQIWDVATRKQLLAFNMPARALIRGMAFGRDGELFATATLNKVIWWRLTAAP
jgi:Hsp70 protein